MSRVLKKGMSVNCRTEEEVQVFKEFAHKEGHRWAGGKKLESMYNNAPQSFQIEYDYRKFPNSVSKSYVDFDGEGITVTQVEASELFRNQLISRRIKNGIS